MCLTQWDSKKKKINTQEYINEKTNQIKAPRKSITRTLLLITLQINTSYPLISTGARKKILALGVCLLGASAQLDAKGEKWTNNDTAECGDKC